MHVLQWARHVLSTLTNLSPSREIDGRAEGLGFWERWQAALSNLRSQCGIFLHLGILPYMSFLSVSFFSLFCLRQHFCLFILTEFLLYYYYHGKVTRYFKLFVVLRKHLWHCYSLQGEHKCDIHIQIKLMKLYLTKGSTVEEGVKGRRLKT